MMGEMPWGAPRCALKPRGLERAGADGRLGVGGPAEQEVSLPTEEEGTSMGKGCVDVDACPESSEKVREVGDWLLGRGCGEFGGSEKNSSDSSDSARSGS